MDKDDFNKLFDKTIIGQQPDKELFSKLVRDLVVEGFIQPLPNNFFSFSNNLTWEVVYETLLFSERRKIHELVARYIERTNEDNIDYVADLLIYHFGKAGNVEKTIRYCAVAGDRAAAMYANDDAIGHYQQAIDLVSNSNSKPIVDVCLLYEKLGDVYENSGRSSDAVNCLERSLEMWRSINQKQRPRYVPWTHKPSVYQASLCHKIAISYDHGSQYELATDWLNRAIALFPAKPGRLAAHVYSTMCGFLYRQGEFQKAVQSGSKALQHARKRKYKKEMATASNAIALAYMEMGMIQRAIIHLEEALAISTDLEDFPCMASAHGNLGLAYQKIGNLEESIRHNRKALELDEKMQNYINISIDYNNLGEIFLQKGELDRAITHLEKVIEYHRTTAPHEGLAGYAMSNLSRALYAMGEVDRAESMLEEGITLLNSSGVQGVMLEAELFRAELLINRNLIDQAVAHIRDLLGAIQANQARLLEAIALRLEGKCLRLQKHFADAKRCLEASDRVAHDIESQYEQARTLLERAELAIDSEDRESQPGDMLRRAEQTFSGMDAVLEQKRVQEIRAKLS